MQALALLCQRTHLFGFWKRHFENWFIHLCSIVKRFLQKYKGEGPKLRPWSGWDKKDKLVPTLVQKFGLYPYFSQQKLGGRIYESLCAAIVVDTNLVSIELLFWIQTTDDVVLVYDRKTIHQISWASSAQNILHPTSSCPKSADMESEIYVPRSIYQTIPNFRWLVSSQTVLEPLPGRLLL